MREARVSIPNVRVQADLRREQCSLSQLAIQFLRNDDIAVDILVVALNQLRHLIHLERERGHTVQSQLRCSSGINMFNIMGGRD